VCHPLRVVSTFLPSPHSARACSVRLTLTLLRFIFRLCAQPPRSPS
jgi:hypothetical protein